MKTRLSLVVTGTIAMVLLFLWLFAIPYSAVQPVHIDIEKSPEDVGLAYDNFSVVPDDKTLNIAGWWMPAENARASLVFIHGGGSARHSSFFDSVPFYADMVHAGVNVAAIDLRNHGLSGDDTSGVQFGLTEKYDALAAVRYARMRAPDLPVFLMGISMGGATAIHAAASNADITGLILLDPLLDTVDVFTRGATVQTGLPGSLFLPSAWSAQLFFGLPSGSSEADALARRLTLPVLLMQDPDDPVTRAVHARALAEENANIEMWMAPPIDGDHRDLMRRGRWQTHVMAYVAFPEKFTMRVLRFLKDNLSPGLAGQTGGLRDG